MLHHNPKWLWKHCKHVIPPPNELMSLVKEVYSTYGPLKDAKTGVPLFNDVAWEATKNVLKVIQQGLVSDPPGVPLYYAYGTDKDGLTLYRCACGTNSTEGGVHRPIRALMPKSGASPRHAHMALLDFILKHNLQVGTYNWTARLIVPTSHVITGWVNGDLYSPTTEVLGILPVPGSIQAEVGMTEFNPDSLDAGQHQHRYLAKVQNTCFAVISVHSKAEKDLFSEMMAKNSFSPSGNGLPNWKHGAKIWNEKANGSTIFYKLHEHLRAYHTEWVSIANQKLTQAQSKEICQAVDKRIRSEQ
ncbi:hypothetical protein FRC02_007000 [Tulasnella sp. 418]|nr:hypothetical protein FRC02_007000 [Tulasnella sp. 418]